MKIAFVVQRYGEDIAGGAEYHCRLVAEHLTRHAEVEVFTTCATDYITWANHYEPGEAMLNGVRVRRFPVTRTRDHVRFGKLTERAFAPGATDADAREWLDEEGPFSPALVEAVTRERAAHDFFVCFSFRYHTTVHALQAAGDRGLLVPTAEDDGVYRLPLFAPVFRSARGIVWNSEEERDMIRGVTGPLPNAVEDVVGVGSALPDHVDPHGFRERHGIAGPFLVYVGRIDRNKGCDELFRHFLRYREDTGSRLQLVLIGKAVIDVPQDAGIVALGFQPDQEKWDGIAASAALAMPSRFESLSMVTLEAWWAGRPVLANARCAVLRGQCRRAQAGLYYATYDEFRESLALLEAQPALGSALGANGRRYFEERYAWPVIERKYLAMFEHIAARRAA